MGRVPDGDAAIEQLPLPSPGSLNPAKPTINPTLVEGQIEGSVYMGYAEAIMEAQRFSDKGLHLN